MTAKSKQRAAPPSPEQQVELRAALEELQSGLLGKATLLVRTMRPPKPEPAELVSETVRRLLARYVDSQIKSASGLAFTVLTRISFDMRRKGRRFDGGFIEDHNEVPDLAPAEPDPFVRAAMAQLEERERCILTRIVIEEESVPKAFELCKWTTRSPYAEYNKALNNLKLHLEQAHERS